LALIWLAVSLPLVMWDMGYVLLRPYSMPGGSLHKPIWSPYELYGTVDYVYGLPAWEEKNGWTAAQTLFNLLETLAYLAYLALVYKYGEQDSTQGRGAPDKSSMGMFSTLSESRTLTGRIAIYAVLLGYSTTFLTFSKTVLYCKCDARRDPLHGLMYQRVDRGLLGLRQHWTQQLVDALLPLDHSKWCLDHLPTLSVVRLRPRDHSRPGDGQRREQEDAVVDVQDISSSDGLYIFEQVIENLQRYHIILF
jgi:hypothetical protein